MSTENEPTNRSEEPREARARFTVGQIVDHVRFGYRGVIFDVDPIFCGTEEWYEQVARSSPPRDAPWYHVMPDQSEHTTYVAERHLIIATDTSELQHPLLTELLSGYEGGQYSPKGGVQ